MLASAHPSRSRLCSWISSAESQRRHEAISGLRRNPISLSAVTKTGHRHRAVRARNRRRRWVAGDGCSALLIGTWHSPLFACTVLLREDALRPLSRGSAISHTPYRAALERAALRIADQW